jgi:hypothetical protein
MFVIRRKIHGTYLAGGKTCYPTWVSDINKARVYSRKCDASNSVLGHYGRYGRYKPVSGIKSTDLEMVEVNISISNSSDPQFKTDINPEVLEKATRYMMEEQATSAGAPSSLISSFKDIDTNTLVKLVTTLYGRK